MDRWDETVRVFSTMTDKLGKPIDPGIFETVVALNVLGVTTRQSCEGHLDWGTSYPWIDIQPEIEQKYQLHQYLAQFYTQRSIDFEIMLVFHGYRLRPNYAAFAELLSSERQRQRLQASQHEILVFTSFLKSLVYGKAL